MEELLKLKREIKNTLSAISLALTSGAGVDNFESYKYMLGQINANEAILQEISRIVASGGYRHPFSRSSSVTSPASVSAAAR